MPANRSRTVRWRSCLEQIHERNGAIEVAVARDYQDEPAGHHLLWRVRVLRLREGEIWTEQPMTLGQSIPVQDGTEMIGLLSVGQNRWMFKTVNLGTAEQPMRDRKPIPALRLKMPERVERCQRRSSHRVDIASVSLPRLDVWPLLDPKSVLVAERANELEFERDRNGADCGRATGGKLSFEDTMPEVGPRFAATLLNLGGGGVGLRVCPEDSQAVQRHKLFWVRMSLQPELRTPICASAKLVHTHMEASQYTYAGLAFDFSFNPPHQRFVVEQICRYLARQQQAQRAGARKTA